MNLYRYIAICILFTAILITQYYGLLAQNQPLTFQGLEKKADSLQLGEKHYEAIEIYKEILQKYEHSLSEEHRFSLFLKTGNSLMYSGQELQAQPWFRQIINVDSSLISEVLLSDAMTGLGRTYEYTGKSDSAFFWYLKAYQLVNESADTLRRARGARNIAQLLRVLERFAEAKNYCRQAVDLIPGIGDFKIVANIYNETAYLFELSEQFDSASYYYEKLITISQQNNYLKGVSTGYNNLASVYEKTGRYQEALDLKLKGLKIDRRIDDTYGIMTSLVSLTESYILLKNYHKAKETLDEAFTLCDSSWIADLSGIHYLYYDIFKKTGNSNEALNNYEKYAVLTDSINQNRSREKVMEILAKYETEKKEQQILLLEQTNLLNESRIRFQWVLIGGLVISGLLILIVVWFFMRHKNHKIKMMQLEIHQFLLRLRNIENPDEKVHQYNDPSETFKKWDLTKREAEILHHLSQGCSNAKIAKNLFISENTVKFHIKNIYIKLNVKNRMEALLRCGKNTIS
jgi:DNA-binding CsgD family transcriptional regulator